MPVALPKAMLRGWDHTVPPHPEAARDGWERCSVSAGGICFLYTQQPKKRHRTPSVRGTDSTRVTVVTNIQLAKVPCPGWWGAGVESATSVQK